MTELDRVGKSDNFNFRGVPSFLQVCKKRSQAPRKRWNVCTVMVLLHIYSKSLGVRLQVCPVNENKILMRIKLCIYTAMYIKDSQLGWVSHLGRFPQLGRS